MRTIEQFPWGENRAGNLSHDSICWQCVKHADRILLEWLDYQLLSRPWVQRLRDRAGDDNAAQSFREAIQRVEVERPVPSGFVDVAIDVDTAKMPGLLDPPTGTLLVQCKTDRDEWLAGDLIRQLKFYRKRHVGPVLGCIVVVNWDDIEPHPQTSHAVACELLNHESMLLLNASASFHRVRPPSECPADMWSEFDEEP